MPAQAVYIWGAPKEWLYPFSFAQQEICIGGTLCQQIDIRRAYFDIPDDKPALIWSMKYLDPSQTHSFILRSMESEGGNDGITTISLHKIVYEVHLEKHRDVLRQVTLVNHTIQNTDDRIQYTPVTSCISRLPFSKCTRRWETSVFDVLAEDRAGHNRRVAQESFSHTQTMLGVSSVDDVPQASFKFRGTAVYVYGAPSSQITLPHAAQQICLDEVCEFLDVHEAYLNPHVVGHLQDASLSESGSPEAVNVSFDTNSVLSSNPDHRSVLLWYAKDLEWDKHHYVSLRMIERNPSIGTPVRGMTIDYVTYTSLRLPRRLLLIPEAGTLVDIFIAVIVVPCLAVLAGLGFFFVLKRLYCYAVGSSQLKNRPSGTSHRRLRPYVQNSGAAPPYGRSSIQTSSPANEHSRLASGFKQTPSPPGSARGE